MALPKSTKATTATKTTSKMVMKAKRVSKIAKGRFAKAMVFRGSKEKTAGGLTKDMVMRNKRGKFCVQEGFRSWQETLQEHRGVDRGHGGGAQGAPTEGLHSRQWEVGAGQGIVRQGESLADRGRR